MRDLALTEKDIQVAKEKVVEKAQSVLKTDLVKVILYGSCARGDYHADSDIDVALLTKCNRDDVKKYNNALGDIATDFASKKKDLGSKNILISELRSGILEESIFDDYKSSVENTRKLMKEAEELDSLISSSNAISEKLNKNQRDLVVIKDSLAVSEGIEELSERLESNVKKLRLISKASQIASKLTEIKRRLSGSEDVESISSNLEEKLSLLRSLQRIRKTQLELKNVSEVLSEDFDFDNPLLKIEEKISSINTAEKKLKDARTLYKKIRVFTNSFIQQEKDLKSAECEFEDLKKSLGVCPLCGGEL